MSATEPGDAHPAGAAVWAAGLLVVIAAGAATAHGLYEVAIASRTPAGIAWLYPLITDGLALVAYAATTRLGGPGRRYAWAVVVLAAGLSGLAQATFLAGGVASASVGLRFGVGAWPAVAAAIAAHLLFLIGTSRTSTADVQGPVSADVQVPVSNSAQPEPRPAVQPSIAPGVQTNGVRRAIGGPSDRPTKALDTAPGRDAGLRPAQSPRERALAVARRHERQHGALPTVRELEALAQVSRGTAATALQELKAAHNGLHVISDDSPEETDS